jgi:hypothetical protein
MHTLLDYLEWPPLLVLIAVMIYRRIYREFPFFFSYILAVLGAGVIRLIVLRIPWTSARQYLYTYWSTEAVLVLLGFLVLYEVFLIRLFPEFNTTRVYRWLFPALGIIAVGLTIWLWLSTPSRGPSRIIAFIGASTMSLNFCQVTLLILFGILIWFMDHEWRRHELGIAGGFGFNATVKLIATGQWVANSYLSTKLDQLPRISYLITILIWIFFLSKTDPVPEELPITEEMAAEADRAYQDIMGLMRGKRRKQS